MKAEVESSISCFGFQRLVPGDFNVVLMGSTCTALPMSRRRDRSASSVQTSLASAATCIGFRRLGGVVAVQEGPG